jgi:DNA topoisomerase-1
MNNATVDGEYDEQRLYELIWKRTVASQMADAEIEKTVIDISNNKNKENLRAQAEVILFEGFLKVYNESVDEEADTEDENAEAQIPPVKEGQVLELKEMNATERFTKPLPRYTEASLVKKLEELGYWKTFYLCAYHFHRSEKKLCSERNARWSRAQIHCAYP